MKPLARRVGLDTSLFIYLVEGHREFGDRASQIFESIEKGRLEAVTSTLTMLELLVQPYRAGNPELTSRYYALFNRYPHLTLRPLDLSTADRAAQLRATYALKTPDAIQVATALEWGAEAFLTNDYKLQRIQELEIITLSGGGGYREP